MPTDDEPTTPVRTFGEELRAHRVKMGLSQAQLALKLIVSASLESAIENGTRIPKHQTAKLADDMFSTPGTFVRLWKLVMQRAYPSHFSPYADLEADATRIHVWEMRCIPGLLQTADYARAVIKAGRPREANNTIDQAVETRMARQEVFTKKGAPLAWFVIDESALYRAYGGKHVMREQVHRLASMADHPDVIIQILPFAVTDHPGVEGPLTIFDFYDSQPIGYAEGRGSGRLIETSADVAEAMACYDLIRAAALPRSATLELLNSRGQNE